MLDNKSRNLFPDFLIILNLWWVYNYIHSRPKMMMRKRERTTKQTINMFIAMHICSAFCCEKSERKKERREGKFPRDTPLFFHSFCHFTFLFLSFFSPMFWIYILSDRSNVAKIYKSYLALQNVCDMKEMIRNIISDNRI